MAEAPTQFMSPFQPGSPQGAQYWQAAGQIEHSYENQVGNIKEQEGVQKAKAAYTEGENAKALGGQLQANEERANRGGILESGINASRRGRLGAGYTATQFRTQQGLQENLRQDIKAQQAALEGRNEKMANLNFQALSDAEKKAAETQSPAEVGGAPAAGAPAVAGGKPKAKPSGYKYGFYPKMVARQQAARKAFKWP